MYDLESMISKINSGGHYPAGGSFKQLEHYRQIYISKKFQMFDYDFKDIQTKPKYKIESINMKKYGTFYPPEYPIMSIQDFNIALVCGKNDSICMPRDYLKL